MKQLIMEAVGTFFLASTVLLLSGNPLAIGLMFMAMIYIGGHISGGYYNPALSFAAFMTGTLDVMKWVRYMIAQLVGAVAAAGLFYFFSGTAFGAQNDGFNVLEAMVPEVLLALVLCLVVLSTLLVPRYKDSHIVGLVNGFTLSGIASFGGLAANPAIALSGVLVSLVVGAETNLMGSVVVQIVGPFVGAALAAVLFQYLNNRD